MGIDRYKLLRISAGIFFGVALFWFLYLKNYEERKLINEANTVISRIEIFRHENSRLPDSLSEIGVKEIERGPIFYEKRGKTNYIIYFNIGFDETKAYYSNAKEWEDFYHK